MHGLDSSNSAWEKSKGLFLSFLGKAFPNPTLPETVWIRPFVSGIPYWVVHLSILRGHIFQNQPYE